jgi:hypothetical protein
MKKLLTIVILIFTVLMFSACQNSMKEFKPLDGGFSILMPGNPTYEKVTSNTVLGPIDIHTFILVGKTHTYAVGYSDYSDSAFRLSTPDQMFDTKRDGTIDNLQGKLLSELIIEMDGYNGREWRIESANERSIFTIRVYIVGHRVYQLEIASAKEDSFSNEVTKYLDSFKLIPNDPLYS